ncbi:ATP-binding protein [Streptomyces sp. RK9]|uniref:ATP-binding protein n=1 Tax=Streptomyces sp. RK9 TaxID=3239284 RepID=UPI0038707E7D
MVTRPSGLSWETRRQNCRRALPGERREFEIASRTPEKSRSDEEPLLQEAEWHLPRHARCVGRARTLLREQASSWELPCETTETATLLLSELMTNAYRHAKVSPGREIWTRCTLKAGRLRIAVSDANATPPAPRQVRPEDASARGSGSNSPSCGGVALTEGDHGDVTRTGGICHTVLRGMRAPPPRHTGQAVRTAPAEAMAGAGGWERARPAIEDEARSADRGRVTRRRRCGRRGPGPGPSRPP